MSNQIKVVCAWCDATISEGRRAMDGGVSHGICKRCAGAKYVSFTGTEGGRVTLKAHHITMQQSQLFPGNWILVLDTVPYVAADVSIAPVW